MPPRSATPLDLEHLACLRGIRCGWLVKATGESAPGKKPKPSVNMCEHVGIMWNHVAWLNHHNRVLVGCFFHKKLRCFSFCVFFFLVYADRFWSQIVFCIRPRAQVVILGFLSQEPQVRPECGLWNSAPKWTTFEGSDYWRLGSHGVRSCQNHLERIILWHLKEVLVNRQISGFHTIGQGVSQKEGIQHIGT